MAEELEILLNSIYSRQHRSIADPCKLHSMLHLDVQQFAQSI